MARTGTRPVLNKVTGSSQTATDQTYVDEKAIQPALNDAWSATVKFDDEYMPPLKVMDSNITYSIDATNAATGNSRWDRVVGDGNTIDLSAFEIGRSDLTVTAGVVTTVNEAIYDIVFSRRGSVSMVHLVDSGETYTAPDTTAPTFSNVSVDNLGETTADFNAQINEAGTIFWAAFPTATAQQSKAVIEAGTGAVDYGSIATSGSTIETDGITGLTASTDYKIHYFGRDSSSNESDAAITSEFTTASGATQLTAPTITSVIADAVDSIEITFTNPNSGNEDGNRIEYKLSSEPTVWTIGVLLAASATTGSQTGLTSSEDYDFRLVAEGSGSFLDSEASNTVTSKSGKILFIDTFDGSTLDTGTWNLTEGADVEVTQNDELIFTDLTTNGSAASSFLNTGGNFERDTSGKLSVFKFSIDESGLTDVTIYRISEIKDASGNERIRLVRDIAPPNTGAFINLIEGGVDNLVDLGVALDGDWKFVLDGDTINVYRHNGTNWGAAVYTGTYTEDVYYWNFVRSVSSVSGNVWKVDNLYCTNFNFDTLNPS